MSIETDRTDLLIEILYEICDALPPNSIWDSVGIRMKIAKLDALCQPPELTLDWDQDLREPMA